MVELPLKWLNNSEFRNIPSMAQERSMSSFSDTVFSLFSENIFLNLRCSQVIVAQSQMIFSCLSQSGLRKSQISIYLLLKPIVTFDRKINEFLYSTILFRQGKQKPSSFWAAFVVKGVDGWQQIYDLIELLFSELLFLMLGTNRRTSLTIVKKRQRVYSCSGRKRQTAIRMSPAIARQS